MAEKHTEWDGARDKVADTIAAWRFQLGYNHKRDNAEIARLRRINTNDADATVDVASAIGIGSFRSLYSGSVRFIDAMPDKDQAGLPWHWTDRARRDLRENGFDTRLAVVAGVLAHVKEDSGGKLGQALNIAGFSELRFRRLIRLETDTELLREGRRLVRILDGRVPVKNLARALLFWDAQETRDLARSYYDAELFGDAAAQNHEHDKDTEDTAR